MITIPTSELTGLLADVAPFADPDDDIPQTHCVRLEWDGDRLHALATDRHCLGWATWHPDDDLGPGEEAQDDLFTEWGGADDPWAITLPLPDAAEHIKVFKLPAKEGRTPLTVDFDPDKRRLTVRRSRDTGHSAITIATDDPVDVEVPDLRKLLADAQRYLAPKQVAYTARLLAGFAKVRPHGPMVLRFTEGLTHVKIGERFTGAIMPVKVED